MRKSTLTAFAVLVIVVVICVTIVVALGKETTELIAFMGSTIIPAAVALWAGNRAEKAAENSEQAVHNTNGRMSELVNAIVDNHGTVDIDKYVDVVGDDVVDRYKRRH